MAVTKAHMSDNRAASINYALGKGKITKNNDNKISEDQKNKLKADGFSEGTIELLLNSNYRAICRSGNVALPENPELEMRKAWELKHAKSKYGAEVSIQSFSEDALDPRDPNNWEKANKLGQLTAKKLYYDKKDNPDNRNILYVVYTHVDNIMDPYNGEYKTPKIHNHIIAMNCNLSTGKSINYHNQHMKILRASNEVMEENSIPYIKDETAYTHPEKRKITTKKRSELGVKSNLRKRYIESKNKHKIDSKNLTLSTHKEQTRMLIDKIIKDNNVNDFNSFIKISAGHGLDIVERKSPSKQGFTNLKFVNHNIKNAYNNGNKQDFAVTSRANGFQNYTKENLIDAINKRINNRKQMASNIDQFRKIKKGLYKKPNLNSKDIKFKNQSNNKSNESTIEQRLLIIIKQQIQALIDLIDRLRKERLSKDYSNNIKLYKYGHFNDAHIFNIKRSGDFLDEIVSADMFTASKNTVADFVKNSISNSNLFKSNLKLFNKSFDSIYFKFDNDQLSDKEILQNNQKESTSNDLNNIKINKNTKLSNNQSEKNIKSNKTKQTNVENQRTYRVPTPNFNNSSKNSNTNPRPPMFRGR